MMDITKVKKLYMTGYDASGQEIVVEIAPTESTIPQISINVDSSFPWLDPFINSTKRTISINMEFKEMYLTTEKDAIDRDELLQLLFEEAS